MIGPDVRTMVERLVGAPATIVNLKVKEGRRTTARATGPLGSAIVKVYESDRAPVVAARAKALAGGPAEPEVPRVLALDADLRTVVLSHVPGVSLGHLLVAGDREAAARTGRALGMWHKAFEGAATHALRPHTPARERAILDGWIARAAPTVADPVRRAAEGLLPDWQPRTVVHRDLYQEQIMVSDHIGLIDVDDAAIGPPELDLGNLLAHLVLLQMTSGCDLRTECAALMTAYRDAGPDVHDELLTRLRRASLLRLACIHQRADLIGA